MSVASMAKAAGIHRSHFSRRFHRETGSSPVEKILEIRMAHARGLLAETSMPVGEVARCVGMSPKHFLKAFRKTCARTPGQYRREVRPIQADAT